jgi:hypothetical protein
LIVLRSGTSWKPDARPTTARIDDAVLADVEVLVGQPEIAPVVVP